MSGSIGTPIAWEITDKDPVRLHLSELAGKESSPDQQREAQEGGADAVNEGLKRMAVCACWLCDISERLVS